MEYNFKISNKKKYVINKIISYAVLRKIICFTIITQIIDYILFYTNLKVIFGNWNP